MIAICIITVVIFILIVILTIPIDCVLDFIYEEKGTSFDMRLKLLWFDFNLSKLFQTKQQDEIGEKQAEQQETDQKASVFERLKEKYIFLKKFIAECGEKLSELIKYILNKAINIKKLDIDIQFGFSQPHITGIATGVINGVVYNAIGIINDCSRLSDYSVMIQPDFYKEKFNAHIYSIIRVRPVNIIIAGIKMINLYMKAKNIK